MTVKHCTGKYLNWAPASCRRGPHRGRPRRWRQTARRTRPPGCPAAGQLPSNVKKRKEKTFRYRLETTKPKRFGIVPEIYRFFDLDQNLLSWIINRNVCSFDGADLGTTTQTFFCFHFLLDVGTFVEHLWNAVLRIRIHRIHMFLGLPDPDPLVRGMDPDPDPSIIMQK